MWLVFVDHYSLSLDNPTKDKMELVLYHNGITAKVYVSYTAGLSSDAEGASEVDLPRRETSSSSKVEQGNNKEKEWIIHEELGKKDSKYRINFI
jgi:hypothetical protein